MQNESNLYDKASESAEAEARPAWEEMLKVIDVAREKVTDPVLRGFADVMGELLTDRIASGNATRSMCNMLDERHTALVAGLADRFGDFDPEEMTQRIDGLEQRISDLEMACEDAATAHRDTLRNVEQEFRRLENRVGILELDGEV